MTVTGLGFDPKICGLVGACLKFGSQWVNHLPSLKLTASLVLKRGWLEDEISFWGPAYFQGLCWFQGPYRDGNMWNTQNQAAKAIGAAALAEIEGTSRCVFGCFLYQESTEFHPWSLTWNLKITISQRNLRISKANFQVPCETLGVQTNQQNEENQHFLCESRAESTKFISLKFLETVCFFCCLYIFEKSSYQSAAWLGRFQNLYEAGCQWPQCQQWKIHGLPGRGCLV